MLSHLTLKDFVVVSAAELAFEAGLTVVSGETGAGKSLLVGALLCLVGARAEAGLVRHGAERAELSAEFELRDAPAAQAWLSEAELDEGGSCQLRRIIRADGGSRAWINGRPATLAQMAQLGALLVQIHGQHEHQALLERSHQLQLLDAFGQHDLLLARVREETQRWVDLDGRLAALSGTGALTERVAYLQHQIAELARENLGAADIEEMLAAHRRQSNCAALLSAYDSALARLAGDDGRSLSGSLYQITQELSRQADSDPRLSDTSALLESAGIQIDEAVNLLERQRDDLDLDPLHLQQLETRLTRLHELSRKHRVPLQDLASRLQALGVELEQLQGQDALGVELLRERDAAAARWRAAAASLSARRQQVAADLSASVTALMSELGMAGGSFAVQLQAQDSARPSALGAERCEFLVAANLGQPPRPLRKAASGGELARISLAIEVAALGLDSVPSMIFDEVDSGIGGAVAEVVGQKLRALGRERQVLCVTHLPQVAAQGHQHFQVSKSTDIAGRSTRSAVLRLDEKARVEELARMLGGIQITRETRANARQMLARAQA